jgi:hypothetical protein
MGDRVWIKVAEGEGVVKHLKRSGKRTDGALLYLNQDLRSGGAILTGERRRVLRLYSKRRPPKGQAVLRLSLLSWLHCQSLR